MSIRIRLSLLLSLFLHVPHLDAEALKKPRIYLQVAQDKLLQPTLAVLRNRMSSYQVNLLNAPHGRIVVEYASAKDRTRLLELIKRQGKLEFREQVKGKWRLAMDGGGVTRALARHVPEEGGWEVFFSLNDQGRKKFAGLTRRLTGKKLAIYLDNEQKLVANILEPLTLGEAKILFPGHGAKAQQEAEAVADCLRGGVLPAPLKILATP